MYKKLSQYGVIGNTHTAALISDEASIDWLCLPQFDSPSLFASILDYQKGGEFQIKPTGKYTSTFKYEEGTNILVTTFETASGVVSVTDFMPVHLDIGAKFHVSDEIHRIVECTKGKVEFEVVFNPKLNYARNKTTITRTNFGVLATDGKDKISVSSNITSSKFSLKNGDRAVFVLAWNHKPKKLSSFTTDKRLRETRGYWKSIGKKLSYKGQWRKEVLRSFLILHLLFYSPTGAIIAAATSSLPEKIGGPRNWDYRFSWVRDAAFTLQALFAVGDYTEVLEYFSWLSNICAGCAPALDVVYGISRGSDLTEKTLKHLEGYKKSAPVRVGNEAALQLQLDIFGEVLDAAYIFHREGGEIPLGTWQFLERVVDFAYKNWQKPDKSFWEVRSGPHHFLVSKLFSWVALDRGIKIATSLGYAQDKLDNWIKIKNQIREEILNKGYKKEVNSFTQHYDTKALDASALLMPLVGFIKVTDPKMISTIDAITSNLEENNFIHRYLPEKTPDGLPGNEGVFLAVNFWLIQNLILLNRTNEAKKMFNRILKTSSPLGIFSEMIDPKTGEMLGNLPQALTHIEVILTAYYLDGLGEIET